MLELRNVRQPNQWELKESKIIRLLKEGPELWTTFVDGGVEREEGNLRTMGEGICRYRKLGYVWGAVSSVVDTGMGHLQW
jgi:hypothetical protein